ncbi:MAG: MMPL family transporter [Pseudomonadota bacterium]
MPLAPVDMSPVTPLPDPGDGSEIGLGDRAVERLVLLSCRFHRLVLVLFALVFALAVWSATGLRVDTDSSRMIDTSLDFQMREARLDDAFPLLDDTIAVVVRSANPDAVDAAMREIGSRLDGDATVADLFAPSLDPFFRSHGLLYLSTEDLRARLATLERTAPFLAALGANPSMGSLFALLDRTEAQGGGAALDPFYDDLAAAMDDALAGRPGAMAWSQIGTQTGQVQRVLQSQPVPDYTDLQPVEGTIEAIGAAIDALDPELSRLVQVGVTGDPALRHEELDSVSRGIGLSLGGSFLVVTVLLLVAYGSMARAGATLLALVVSLVLATGFAAQAFAALNLVSVAFVVLLVGLGLDFTIHAFLHIDGRGDGPARAAQIARMGREIGGALLLGAGTTVLAFLAFVPTDFDGIAQLGVLGAAGVVIALIVALTFMPALVMAWPRLAIGLPPRRTSKAAGGTRAGRIGRVALLVAVVPAALWVGREVRFDADPTVLRDPNAASMQALAWLHDDPETVPYRLSALTGSADSASALARILDGLPLVASARMLDDFLPDDQTEKLRLLDGARGTLAGIAAEATQPPLDGAAGPAADALARRLATSGRPSTERLRGTILDWSAADAAARDRAERAVFRFLPLFLDTLGRQATAGAATRDDLPAAVVRRFRADDLWRVEIVPAADPRDQDDLSDFVAAVDARVAETGDATLAGPPVHILRAGQTVAAAIVQALAVAGLATLLLCFAMLRDWRLVVAIIVPLAAAAALTAAASAALGIAFNYANVIVLPLIIGLGVDSGIHLALRRRSLGAGRPLAATNTPRAVVFSGLTTIAAFGSLMLSDHQGTASMGLMLAVAVTLTLATTLIWTPALCELLDKRARAPSG